MHISDEKWEQLCAETKAGVDRWNARATERQRPGTFTFEVMSVGGLDGISTGHREEYGPPDIEVLARERTTGHVRSTKAVIKRGRIVAIKTKTADPKAWSQLAGKPVGAIIKQTKLLGFLTVLDSRMTEATSVPS